MSSTLTEDAASAPVAPQLLSGPAKLGLSPSEVHVLLVDDERLSRTVVAGLLSRCGYRGEDPGREARLAQWQRPHVGRHGAA